MKTTPIALGILERELVRQIIKLAAEGPLAQPVPPQPVKPNTADKVVEPIKKIAPLGKTTGGQSGRSMFDRQGPGDAQARAAIYGKTKQIGSQIYNASSQLGDRIGSMLPVGKPGNSGFGNKPSTYAYGPGGGGAGSPDVAGAASKAVGAIDSRLPKPSASYAYGPGGGVGPSLSDVADAGRGFVSGTKQLGDRIGSMLPVGKPGNSGFGDKPMSMVDEMRGTFKQMGSDIQQVGSTVNNARLQAGNAIGDYVGSMLPVGKPGNSGFGQDPAAYGAAPPQGPMGTGVPGPGQDPAAYGAAPPQGPMGPATPTIPPFTPSPEMQQFMTDNNIRTKDDLGNLTEEQQLQFDDLYEKQQQQPAAPASKPSTYAYGMGPASASAQTAPKTQQPAQAATPAQPPEQQQNVPNSVKAWGGSLPEQATPDQRAQADQAQQQLADKSPEEKQKLSTAINDPKSPEAQEVNANAANNYMAEAAADPNNPAPKDPQGYGEWAQGKLNEFGQLDPMAQLAIGAGLSIGVVSMLSSMMGGGGMGGMLLGALGLGAAGMVGASTGMLGGDAKGWVNDAFSGLVTAFGGNVPNEADIRARLEAAAQKGPEAANAELEKVRGEVQPYAAFSQDAKKFVTDSADPNYLYNQAQQYGRDNYADLASQSTTWGMPTGAITSAIFGKPEMEDADPNNRTWNEWAWGAPGSEQREQNIDKGVQGKGFKRASFAVSVMRKAVAVSAMRKAARCWAGYEPVPGKKPYSDNSCRPKGKKKKKTEKKAGGPGTGSFTLGGHQAPAPVALKGAWTPEIAARVAPLLQTHNRYKKTDFSDPVKSRGAALSLLKTRGLSQDLRDNLHREIGSSGDHRGLANFPGMPAAAQAAGRAAAPSPARPVSAPAATPAAPALPPAPRPQATTPPAPVPTPKPRPDGRPVMIPKLPPQTTSTGPAQPPASSIGANGQYQPSILAAQGTGLPR